MGGSCIICGKKKSVRHNIFLHRFPKKQAVRIKLLSSLRLTEGDITENSRVCSMHFRDGNPCNIPSLSIGEKFALQPSVDSERRKRAQKHGTTSTLCTPPATKKQYSSAESDSEQSHEQLPPTLTVSPVKTMAERRGTQDVDVESEVSCASSACDSFSLSSPHSFTPLSSAPLLELQPQQVIFRHQMYQFHFQSWNCPPVTVRMT